ncbi:hypothetical protein C7271_08940 [filamentous cyanobacterium CCP5]|nr:hypothetical protein C7271_08940 [filamentous cyanobacterium CCP5]
MSSIELWLWVMQSFVLKSIVWLLAEVCLTAIGTDDLADYGEYVFNVRGDAPSQAIAIVEYHCWNGVCTPQGWPSPAAPDLMAAL